MGALQLDTDATPPETAPLLPHVIVLFGATGDLAYKQIFPALQQMVIRGEQRGA